MLQSVRRLSKLSNIRFYVVKSTIEVPNDTSKAEFKVMNVTDRMIQATQKENEIISVLQAIQPFKITDDFVAFSDQLFNKELKDSITADVESKKDQTQEVSVKGSIQGEYLESSTSFLSRAVSPDYLTIIQEFIRDKPELSSQSIEQILQLNPEEYQKIQLSRAEKILQFCQKLKQ